MKYRELDQMKRFKHFINDFTFEDDAVVLSESQFLDFAEHPESKWAELGEHCGIPNLVESLKSEEKLVDDLESGQTWGNDTFIFLPIKKKKTDNGADTLEKASDGDNDKTDTNTYSYLKKHRHGGGEEFARGDVEKSSVRWKLGDNDTIMVKSFWEDDYRPATEDEIREMLANKSYKYTNYSRYIFDGDVLKLAPGYSITNPDPSDEDILKIAKPLTTNQYNGVTKTVNSFAKTARNFTTGFRFAGKGSVLKKIDNLTQDDWKMDSEQRIPLYEKPVSELEPLTDADKELVLKALNKGNKPVAGLSRQKMYRLSDGKVQIKVGGDGDWTDMTHSELEKFIQGLSQVDFNREREDGRKYMDSFFISTSGSKVGEYVGNFSVPPFATCAEDVPCAKEGCYAMHAYSAKPTTRAAWGKNYVLLNEGKYKEFEDTVSDFIGNNRNPIELFRFNVSGDLFSKEYLDSIINIAERCGGTQFWLYTKKYDLIESAVDSLPSNLHIILSAWGRDFIPNVDLQMKFPVAYLDDNTEDVKEMLDSIGDTLSESMDEKKVGSSKPEIIKVKVGNNDFQEIVKRTKFYCPCTSYSDSGMQCKECRACFEKLWNGKKVAHNLVFKKH